ncbi:MAG: zinc-ribbon domain-containing protein, partial [Candidatus Acidiferrales bacterium]
PAPKAGASANSATSAWWHSIASASLCHVQAVCVTPPGGVSCCAVAIRPWCLSRWSFASPPQIMLCAALSSDSLRGKFVGLAKLTPVGRKIMAYCSKCGSELAEGAAFCPKCGQAQAGGQAPHAAQSTSTGMAENVAGLLCYLLGWLTGIIFFLIDKRPFVRFHAAQSMVVFGGLFAIRIVIGAFFGAGFFMSGFGFFGMMGALYGLIALVSIVLWILLMVKAYQGEKFEVPLAAGLAKTIASK